MKNPFLDCMLTDIIHCNAKNENGQYTQNGMKDECFRRIVACIVQQVFPKPLTHRITVGVYQQDTECAGTDCIDKRAVTDM